MEELNETQLELLKMSCYIAARDYTPENEGKIANIDKDSIQYTPKNIKAIYNELKELFKEG